MPIFTVHSVYGREYPSVFRAPRRPCSGRRAVAVLREASRPHHLSIHTAFDRLESEHGESQNLRSG